MKKIFISYSHRDESFKDEFLRFLSHLESDGVAKIFNDRMISLGKALDESIREELFSSDIVIFLVSQDFLISPYCRDVELAESLKRFNEPVQRLIPVVVGHCQWLHSPLKRFVAPFDGAPLCDFPNRDKHWNDLANSLRGIVDELGNQLQGADAHYGGVVSAPVSAAEDLYQDDFLRKLSDTDVVLSNEAIPRLSLDHIYVWPEVRHYSEDMGEVDIISPSKKFLKSRRRSGVYLVVGEEQAGKTALSRRLCKELINDEKYPVLVSGSDISTPKIDDLISLASKRCFKGDVDRNMVGAVIIDEFQKIKLNKKFTIKMLDELLDAGIDIYCFSLPDIRYNEDIFGYFEVMNVCELIPLSPSLRDELICKWLSAGRETLIDEKELNNSRDEAAKLVDLVVRKNVVPPRPIFVLILLQTRDGLAANQDSNLSSYGYCYQRLLLQSFERSGIKGRQVDSFLNYLCALAFSIYKTNKSFISDGEFSDFEVDYYSSYLSKDKSIGSVLVSNGILKSEGDKVYFSYRYIFYYCVGKYIADNLSSFGAAEVNELCLNMHILRNSNILIFVAHHTRDAALVQGL